MTGQMFDQPRARSEIGAQALSSDDALGFRPRLKLRSRCSRSRHPIHRASGRSASQPSGPGAQNLIQIRRLHAHFRDNLQLRSPQDLHRRPLAIATWTLAVCAVVSPSFERGAELRLAAPADGAFARPVANCRNFFGVAHGGRDLFGDFTNPRCPMMPNARYGWSPIGAPTTLQMWRMRWAQAKGELRRASDLPQERWMRELRSSIMVSDTS